MREAGVQEEKRPSFPSFPEGQCGPEALASGNLCALCILFVHPLVFNPGGSKGKVESPSIKRFVSFVFAEEKLCGLCVLCG